MVPLILSILTSSVINVEISWYDNLDNPYTWDNRYLTFEEVQINGYFKDKDVDGLIFVADPYIAERIGAVGFLPTFSTSVLIGLPLYDSTTTPDYVYQHNKFSLKEFLNYFIFFNFAQKDPVDELRDIIKNLNVRVESDIDVFLS